MGIGPRGDFTLLVELFLYAKDSWLFVCGKLYLVLGCLFGVNCIWCGSGSWNWAILRFSFMVLTLLCSCDDFEVIDLFDCYEISLVLRW